MNIGFIFLQDYISETAKPYLECPLLYYVFTNYVSVHNCNEHTFHNFI